VTAPAADGVLVVDKPAGPTSHDVVAVARRALATSRVGHTGTLDPMATGVLVLVAGRATRLARFMAHDAKDYVAEITFGRATTTSDATGETTRETGSAPTRADLEARVAGALGPQLQTPPAYSAKKVGGEVAYRAARRDTPLTLAPVPVVVHALTLEAYDRGVARIAMRVSAGFYVRALAHDLGEALGTGAHLSGLRRTRAGAFDLSQAASWQAVATAGRGALVPALLPLERLLPELPRAVLAPDAVMRARQGQIVQVPGATPDTTPPPGPVRLLDEAGHLIGIGTAATPPGRSGAFLQPVVILG